MNILLHICCAPCAIYPIEKLRKDGHKIGGYFYNPNIHPYSEYVRRLDQLQKYSKKAGLNVICGEYEIENYFQHIVYNEERENRCPVCWWLRMDKTVSFAKNNGFDAFTTTLLGSPYQDQDTIKAICKDIAKASGVKFIFVDFRAGFKKAHELAKKEGIYCQNYCGCLYSERERLEKRKKKNVSMEAGDTAKTHPDNKDRTIVLGVKGSKKKIKCSI